MSAALWDLDSIKVTPSYLFSINQGNSDIAAAEWDGGVVDQPAAYIAETQPGLRGLTRLNLFRMRQFYEAYQGDDKVAPLVRQSHPLAVGAFKDAYMVEFLGLPEGHSESDLHRGLLAKLKVGRFEPEYIGKLLFYLEALDRDVRKPHENPAIGVLLCASKDDEVVEYALSRSASPALIAEYQPQLPDKALLQAKLHEFFLQDAGDVDDAEGGA